MRFSSRLFAAFAALGFVATLSAQLPGARPPPIKSPVVNVDRTVTFKLRAPDAKTVELSGQFQKANQPLAKDDAGIWSITVGPIEPNLYPYNFVVDGVGVADPANQDVFPNEGFKASLVDIPGDQPVIYSMQEVPHGELTYCYYESRTLHRTRPLIVYTPPGYRAGTDKYPVLYLISGTTDTEETWFKVGRANVISRQPPRAEKSRPNDHRAALRQHDGWHANAVVAAGRGDV